jgi:hypothetical protein
VDPDHTGEPWAYHIVNRYFDEFFPRAIALAEQVCGTPSAGHRPAARALPVCCTAAGSGCGSDAQHWVLPVPRVPANCTPSPPSARFLSAPAAVSAACAVAAAGAAAQHQLPLHDAELAGRSFSRLRSRRHAQLGARVGGSVRGGFTPSFVNVCVWGGLASSVLCVDTCANYNRSRAESVCSDSGPARIPVIPDGLGLAVVQAGSGHAAIGTPTLHCPNASAIAGVKAALRRGDLFFHGFSSDNEARCGAAACACMRARVRGITALADQALAAAATTPMPRSLKQPSRSASASAT